MSNWSNTDRMDLCSEGKETLRNEAFIFGFGCRSSCPVSQLRDLGCFTYTEMHGCLTKQRGGQ